MLVLAMAHSDFGRLSAKRLKAPQSSCGRPRESGWDVKSGRSVYAKSKRCLFRNKATLHGKNSISHTREVPQRKREDKHSSREGRATETSRKEGYKVEESWFPFALSND